MDKKTKRGSISRRLGIPIASKLTKAIIREKISILDAGLKDDKFTGELRRYAVYYRSWYRFRLKNDKKAA